MNQTVTKTVLRSLGYRVTLVADSIRAIRSAERQCYDAILMDCRLPMLDGYSATRKIKARENGRRVPIIAPTANAPQGDRESYLQAGMNDYLARPFKRVELQRILQRQVSSWSELPVTSNETGRGKPGWSTTRAVSGRGNKVDICSPDTMVFTATQQSMTRLPLRY